MKGLQGCPEASGFGFRVMCLGFRVKSPFVVPFLLIKSML